MSERPLWMQIMCGVIAGAVIVVTQGGCAALPALAGASSAGLTLYKKQQSTVGDITGASAELTLVKFHHTSVVNNYYYSCRKHGTCKQK
jgi:hypothetical protein